jgi:hypothetical protein
MNSLLFHWAANGLDVQSHSGKLAASGRLRTTTLAVRRTLEVTLKLGEFIGISGLNKKSIKFLTMRLEVNWMTSGRRFDASFPSSLRS